MGGSMKFKIIAILTCSSLITSPTLANDDFVSGLMGAMIGAAISSQGNANTNKKRSNKSRISSATRQKNKEIQEALNYFGFIAGVPDGVLGRKSRIAMSQFQACINRPITGKLDAFEEQFLKNSFYKAQAGGNATLRLVATKSNGYCGVLQEFHQELTQPVAQTNSAQQNTTGGVTQNTTVVVNQQNTQTNTTVTNSTLVVIDSELQTKFDLMVAQLKLLEQIQTHLDAKATDESSKRKLATVIDGIDELRGMIREVKSQTKVKYGTPIKPTNANLGVTAVKASEVFPRVPYYIPGTDETGEMWVKPHVTDGGELMYDFNFVASHSDFERIKDTIGMSSNNVRAVAEALVKVTKWSDVAISKGMRRRYEKSAVCFPQDMCGKSEAGNNSAEVIFMLYEDGSTAARLQENKGRFRSGYNLSVESGLLLSAYMDYMAEIGENEFEANTMTDEDLDIVFQD